jgi:hypothetical protein
MFYTDEEVVNLINEVFFKKNQDHGNSITPKIESVLELLNDRKPILFFYLTTEQGEPEMLEADMQIPTINMKLNQFFIHPFGNNIWIDDESFKFITHDNYLLIKDSIERSIQERYVSYKVENYDEFVQKLNNKKKFVN